MAKILILSIIGQTVSFHIFRDSPVTRYDLLWGKLRQTGVPGPYVDLFSHWYEHQTNQIRWSNTLSEEYRLECGVRQGGLTSPALFNLYINELIRALGGARVGCSIDGHCMNSINYADDMVLLSPWSVPSGVYCPSVRGTQNLTGSVIMLKKSELLVFKVAKKKPTYVPPVTLGGVPLKRVTEFKYLGHIVTEHLKDDADIERERRALAVRCNMLAPSLKHSTYLRAFSSLEHSRVKTDDSGGNLIF
ncbi:unnamed protein product [Pieris brassicae]|uniref:Reverse transcriptase domain-containing protein n=1 Tax=Pieris brassicae TaxID=7116 RepID=A0A9P0TNJ9_PIEBR|nr:unnamed protein product [Pieris brassicae]